VTQKICCNVSLNYEMISFAIPSTLVVPPSSR
jgi:hypothetical protein